MPVGEISVDIKDWKNGPADLRQKVIIDWTSDASGNVDQEIVDSEGDSVEFYGDIRRVVTNPDDTSIPTALYNLKVIDEEDCDTLGGAGDDRLHDEVQHLTPLIGIVAGPCRVSGLLSIQISGAGDTKKGRAVLLVDR